MAPVILVRDWKQTEAALLAARASGTTPVLLTPENAAATYGAGYLGALQTRAREALLPIVMMPVVLPMLLASVRASTSILDGTPQADWIQWVQIIVVLDVIYVTMCFLLFEFVVEE